jgi:DNA (cytosine-5)-methyltransferase 1
MLRVIELFGGIGAFSSALDRLKKDYEIVDYVDKDSAAVQSYNAIHNTNLPPLNMLVQIVNLLNRQATQL